MLDRAGPLEALPREEWPAGNGPARYYRRPGGRGTVGFITALSCGFCHLCNRVRLSARGKLVPCLDGDDGADLGSALREGAGREAIKMMILGVIASKPERHHMLEREEAEASNPRTMCQIGG
jgi:cyclic pyranopterin phosphate synthase